MKLLASLWLFCVLWLLACHDQRRLPGTHTADTSSMPPVSYVYYDFGGPPEPAFAEAQKTVLARYSLLYRGFGCVVTDSLIGAVQQHNDSLFRYLQKRFPGFTEARLRQEIQAYRDTGSHRRYQ